MFFTHLRCLLLLLLDENIIYTQMKMASTLPFKSYGSVRLLCF